MRQLSLIVVPMQLAFRVPGLSTPSSDNSTSSFGDFSFNFDFSGSSLSPGYLVGGPSEGEDAASDVSVVSSSLSDRGASPVPSVSSEGTTSTTVEHLVPPPVTVFRRHSVGQTDAPLGRSDSEKTVTKRGMSEDVHVDGDAFNVDINENQQVVMSDVRGSKRIRPFAAVTATSAPALLTIPLPAVESTPYTATNDASLTHDDNNNQPTAPTSTPTSTSTSAAPSSSSSSAPAPAPRRTRRRGGGATRAKRTQCEYCSKSFSRVQDAQRHVATSCAASPDRTGIECPACDSVLSRLDAAQRHWRGKHENSTCEPPEWALHA